MRRAPITSPAPLARWLVTLDPVGASATEGLLALVQVILEEGHEQEVLCLRTTGAREGHAIAAYLQAVRGGLPLWRWSPPGQGWHTVSRVARDAALGPRWRSGLDALQISASPLRPGWPVEIALALHSEVWFPRLPALRMMDHHHRPPNPFSPRALDNRALALHHSPRLNTFLENLAGSVAVLGGRWHLDDTRAGAWYRPMCHQHGIDLPDETGAHP